MGTRSRRRCGLSGHLDAYAKKLAAKEAALRVRGVKAVADEIEVQLPSAAQRTDADIAATAATEDLDVSVSKGIVTLSGDVEYTYERQDAERMVRRLAGVRGVVNLLPSAYGEPAIALGT